MASFNDSLRGYAFGIHQRDGFKCRYCGADGSKSFETWLTFSWDHLLPKGHEKRDNPDYIVTACNFCNTADNRYFDKADELGFKFDNMTPDQLVDQRKPFVEKTRHDYRKFWEENVKRS
jgi:Fe-S oxidoreductase